MITNSIDTNTDVVCSSAITNDQRSKADSDWTHGPRKRDESQRLKSQTCILQLPVQMSKVKHSHTVRKFLAHKGIVAVVAFHL